MSYSPAIGQPNRFLPDPELQDVLSEIQRSTMLKTNCHAVGIITGFDSTEQKATAQIMYKRAFVNQKSNGDYEIEEKEYPLISNAPIISLYGGDAGITFPIKKGDYCLVLFNDRDMDVFLKYNQSTVPNSPRMHSLADAIILVGLRPFSKPLTNYDTQRAKLFNKNTQVAVKDGKIKIDNGTQNLKTLLSDLKSALSTFATSCSASADPTLAAASGVLNTALTNVQTEINGLLE